MTRYCYRIFNTNNLWVSMSAMKSVVEKHFLHMEIIINPKVWFWSITLRFVIDYFCCFSTVNEQFLHGTSVHYSLLSAIGIVVCWWYCVFKVGHILILVLTHTHPFKGPGTTWVSQYQEVKPIWILLKQETVSGSGISRAICKSAPCSRQITMPAPHPSVFLQAGCPSCHPTNSVKALKALIVVLMIA